MKSSTLLRRSLVTAACTATIALGYGATTRSTARTLAAITFPHAEPAAASAPAVASDPGGNLYVGQTLGPNSGDVMP